MNLIDKAEREEHRKDMAVIEENHTRRRSRFQNLQRLLHKNRQESQLLEKVHQKEEEMVAHEQKYKLDEALATELDKIKREKHKDESYRRNLRNTSHELLELEQVLKNAYIHKELAAQIEYKRGERLYDKLKAKQELQLINAARIKEEAVLRTQAEEHVKKAQSYRKDLQDQMIYQEKMRRKKYEEYLQEKKMIDAIIDRVHHEDEKNRMEKKCRELATKEEIKNHILAQKAFKEKKMKEIDEEDRRNQQFLVEKERAIEKLRAEKEQKKMLKASIVDNMFEKFFLDQTQKRMKDEVIKDLKRIEMEDAANQRKLNNQKEAEKIKADMRASIIEQIKEQHERKEREAALDDALKQKMLEKFLEDEKQAKLQEQQRREMWIQVRKDNEQTMRDKRQKLVEDRQIQKRLREEQERKDIERDIIVKEEKINMLKDHWMNVGEHVPRRILRPGDLDFLGVGGNS